MQLAYLVADEFAPPRDFVKLSAVDVLFPDLDDGDSALEGEFEVVEVRVGWGRRSRREERPAGHVVQRVVHCRARHLVELLSQKSDERTLRKGRKRAVAARNDSQSEWAASRPNGSRGTHLA